MFNVLRSERRVRAPGAWTLPLLLY